MICEKDKFVMYITYHTIMFNMNDDFIYFGVNEIYDKYKFHNQVLEYELEIYNPFLQKRGYMETSTYLHVYWNKLYKDKEMIGFAQYDMFHPTYELSNDILYIFNIQNEDKIVENGMWNPLMFSNIVDLEYLIDHYNTFFHKKYSIKELENMPLSLFQTNIYPIKIYEKLCKWLEVLVKDIYPSKNQPPYETHFGSIGGYTERAMSIFNAFEIYEGQKYDVLNIKMYAKDLPRLQYDTKCYLNNYSQEVYTKFIDNITSSNNDIQSSSKTQCYLNGLYSCERINQINNNNNKNGLQLTNQFSNKITDYGFDIDAQDPKLFILNDCVYILFHCLSPYKDQYKCMAITKFNEWNPIFLQTETKNIIEKNWAPFVKDNQLFFIYNYDPLVVLYYDFNSNGMCTVINDKCLFNNSNSNIRGGNLIHYKDEYYIGVCESRIYKDEFQYYTHIVLLDTKKWEIVYISKPVMYLCNIKEELNSWHLNKRITKKIDTINSIIVDKTPNIIQTPISLYKKDNTYCITVNIRNCISFLYEIRFENLFDFLTIDKPVGFYEKYIKNLSL